jgi:threonine aldolase
MTDLRSDTVTRPSPAMRQAMADAAVGDDVYGEDPTVCELEQLAARLLGKEAALYLPTATMSNQVAVLTHTDRGDEMFCDRDAHIYYYEVGSPAMLAGVTFHTLDHREGVIAPDVLRAAIRPANVHHPRPRLLSLENTHNRAGGAALTRGQLQPLADVAHEHGLRVHLDGSRLFNAAVALGVDPAELAAVADSVTLCLSKGLGAPMGALLVGEASFIERARRYRKALGGGMRQAGIVAAGGLYGLRHNVERLAEDHRRAARLADGLRGLPGLTVMQPAVPTNMVVVDLDRPAEPVMAEGARAGILFGAMGPQRLRLVTHLDVDDAGIDAAIDFFRRTFSAGRQ